MTGVVSKQTLKRLKKKPLRFQAKTMVSVEQCLKKNPLKSKKKTLCLPGSLLFTTLLLVRETTKKKPFVQSLARWHCLAIGVWHRLSGFSSIGTRLSTQQGLANKIDRIKNARTRIVQGSWD